MIPNIPDLPEFADYVAHRPQDDAAEVWKNVLNNFHLRYPRTAYSDGKKNHPACSGSYRDLSAELGWFDDKHSMHHVNRDPDRNSERYMEMTDREYFAMLDTAITTCGYTTDTIAHAGMIRAFKSREDHSWIEVFATIYVYLRKQGFTEADLAR